MPGETTYRLPDSEIEHFVTEDCPYGDLTTALLEIGSKPGRIVFATRHQTVACCTEDAARLFERLECTPSVLCPSGALMEAGVALVEARGDAGSLHMGWKAAVNLLESACGIATRTHALVSAARSVSPAIEVVATRKVFPGTKGVATKAVYAGGALPHRLGLSESVLVFAQHVAFLAGPDELWARLPSIKARAKEKKIAVEVTGEAEALQAVRAGADMVQVDKLGPVEVSKLVKAVKAAAPQVIVAAAGGINVDNVKAYAATGADVLVTSSMYWGKPADIAVTMEALPA
jgi:molybdenum transport protein